MDYALSKEDPRMANAKRLLVLRSALCVWFACLGATLSAEDLGVTIYYEGNAQVELISPEGTRVLIDIANPERLSSPATSRDILITTHSHWDHFKPSFASAFPGRQLKFEEGQIDLPDVKLKTIPASHTSFPPGPDVPPSNYIVLIQMGGLRIAHLGDTEQEGLTEDQLAELGMIDVGIMEFWEVYDSAGNNKFFTIADQVKPKLIIPTHLEGPALQQAARNWPCFYESKDHVNIAGATLPSDTRFLVFGTNDIGKLLAPVYKLPAWE
jgi:L-ascorbate metabolism protein UlaG (beta-lactamase superfamily)